MMRASFQSDRLRGSWGDWWVGVNTVVYTWDPPSPATAAAAAHVYIAAAVNSQNQTMMMVRVFATAGLQNYTGMEVAWWLMLRGCMGER